MSGSYAGEGEKLPVLVLTCQRDSHPFHERSIELSEVIKVGRSVARAKPADTNAIFDCKVLSRSHALIWYKNGRFWLRDTNSSNGTFVNNTRVVKHAGEEYADREIFSGDVIRFGVDVTENGTTHGCIIARVTLFHPNGAEAKLCAEPVGSANGVMAIETLHTEQVFRLAHFVGEALFREQLLENKLSSLSRLLQETQDMAETGWQAILNEERLLHTLDLYESQLSVLKEDLSPDSLESRICQVLEEKVNLEKASEMMLNRLVKEKMEALSKVTTLECCLSDLERECSGLRQDYATTSEAYQAVTQDYGTKCSELAQLENRIKDIQIEKDKLGAQLVERTHEIELLHKNLEFAALRAKDSKSLHDPADEKTDADFNLLLNGLNNGPVENPDYTTDRLTDSEAGLDRIPDWTPDGLSKQLADSMRQFQESMQLSNSLQEEITLLSYLSLPRAHDGPILNADDDLSQSDQVSSFTDSAESETKKHTYSASLWRIRSLAARVTACQARVEASLSTCCALQRRLKNAPSVCNTSGDVCVPASNPAEPSDHQVIKDDGLTVNASLVPAAQSSPNAQTQKSSPDSKSMSLLDNDAQSPIEEMEIDHLREAFRRAQHETEQVRQVAETYRLQDAAKAELLLTVREECDALRKRIAHIEADVTISREDHQRLVTEARRTRSEADELRQERDNLNAQVTTCTHRIEQLQAALDRNSNLASSSSTTTTVPSLNRVIANTDDGNLLHPNTSAFGSIRSSALTVLAPSFRSPTGTLSLFVVVPIMILMLALIVYVHSKFV